MTDDDVNHAQVEAAAEVLHEAVLACLKAGEVHPRAVLLAAARVAGELGADAALASGEDLEEVLGVLVEVLARAGIEHHLALRSGPPTMGSA